MAIVTLTSKRGLTIRLSTFGASWLSCQVACNKEGYREIVLGCDEQQLANQDMYLGASVGRYANRIAHAQFELNNQCYQLSANQDHQHTLHGGKDNFSYREWHIVQQTNKSVTFEIESLDGDQGFNGTFIARISYTVTDQQVIIDYHATNDQLSVCSLTNHAYFNLNGIHNEHNLDGTKQYLQIFSQQYLPINGDGLPANQDKDLLQSVENTPFDFRQTKLIQQDFAKVLSPVNGYDHDWYFGHNGTMKPVCVLTAFDATVSMSVQSTHSALHLYTGNFLHDIYQSYAGIALETGCLVNSPNLYQYQHQCLIAQDKPYQHQTIYQFTW